MSGLIDLYEKEVECVYKGEIYSVRDNGSIKRHCKEGKKPRPSDEKWTFGSYDLTDGYAKFCGQNVHRIVAVAFHGEPPTSQHVVDHIDTNRQNNRPENLRWVTKLENVLLNPITRKKLELLCGCPVEEILKDMSILRDKNLEPNIAWMHAVTKEEATKTLERWNKWVEQGTVAEKRMPKIDPYTYFLHTKDQQKDNYPLEPKTVSLEDYLANLKIGKVFFSKQYGNEVGKSKIVDFYLNKDQQKLYVACESTNPIKPYYLSEVTINNGQYEYGGRSLFAAASIDKYMTEARGEEWTGGDVIDDYC